MSALLPADRAAWWAPATAWCFLCLEDVPTTVPAVMWSGTRRILLHVPCARKLGAHLIGDAREAELASGVRPWATRAARVAGSALRVLEPVR